jgi:Phosphotransferase enzyme family
MPRTATVVLINGRHEILGALAPFELERPWWQESADIVQAVRDQHGIDVVILRILEADQPHPPGGHVTYLAQTEERPTAATPVEIDQTPQPKRNSYAEVNGPHETLAWARTHLGPISVAKQHRTWNLSMIWRLDGVWLKQVPPFFAHEAAVIRWAAAHNARVPELIAADNGRMLMRDIPGEDLYEAGLEVRAAIGVDNHHIQLASLSALDELAAMGVPDGRRDQLVASLQAAFPAHPLVRRVPELLDRALDCGVPETLVHGDLHPGNARGDAYHRTLLDWGDSFLGHPAFDIIRLTGGLADADAKLLLDQWAQRWRAAIPGSDPLRTVELLRPVAALRAAGVYANFLADIEPAEHPYHTGDVPFWLQRAEELGAALD